MGKLEKTFAVALSSLKGGTGKTTLAYNLAERAWSSGLETAVIDYDREEGAIGLADLRDKPAWAMFSNRVGVTGAEHLASLKTEGSYRLLVCDLPGAEGMVLGRLLMEMDLVLSPVGVGAADLLAAANFAWMVKRMELPVTFIPNNLPPGQSRRQELLAELGKLGVDVCPVMLQRRVAHLDALRLGQGVCEVSPTSAAAQEVKALWSWLCRRLEVDLVGVEK